LRQPNDKFVLVIDGLDEHSFYGTVNGLLWLTNELAELRCPIVLATRKEHFLSLIGNYELAAETLSRKGGGDRIVEVFELGTWSSVHAQQLVEGAMHTVPRDDRRASTIGKLLEQLRSGSSLSALLLSHPLFLQMTLDLIMDGEERFLTDEDRLIEVWARKKIRRDLLVPRVDLPTGLDVEHYVEAMMDVMTRVAIEMQFGSDEAEYAPESIDVEKVVGIVRDAIPMVKLDPVTVLTTSFLVPVSRRRGRDLNARFFHQKLYEFFIRRGEKGERE
jgi:hypothetical protein